MIPRYRTDGQPYAALRQKPYRKEILVQTTQDESVIESTLYLFRGREVLFLSRLLLQKTLLRCVLAIRSESKALESIRFLSEHPSEHLKYRFCSGHNRVSQISLKFKKM